MREASWYKHILYVNFHETRCGLILLPYRFGAGWLRSTSLYDVEAETALIVAKVPSFT